MKYLFLSLLLLNILYALWQFQVRAPVPSDGVGTPLLESQLSSVPSALRGVSPKLCAPSCMRGAFRGREEIRPRRGRGCPRRRAPHAFPPDRGCR